MTNKPRLQFNVDEPQDIFVIEKKPGTFDGQYGKSYILKVQHDNQEKVVFGERLCLEIASYEIGSKLRVCKETKNNGATAFKVENLGGETLSGNTKKEEFNSLKNSFNNIKSEYKPKKEVDWDEIGRIKCRCTFANIAYEQGLEPTEEVINNINEWVEYVQTGKMDEINNIELPE